jgi:hypothetical protein
MSFIRGKRGDAGEISWPQVVFIVLIIAFVGMFFIFARNSLNGALIQEEIYAKKIALMIDSARPNTTFSIDLTKLAEIAKKNKGENSDLSNIIYLTENGYVKVSLRLGGNGYKYSYFSDYNITGKYDSPGGKPYYFVKVEKKNE